MKTRGIKGLYISTLVPQTEGLFSNNTHILLKLSVLVGIIENFVRLLSSVIITDRVQVRRPRQSFDTTSKIPPTSDAT